MRPFVLALLLVLVTATSASAEKKKRRVLIVTQPAGATVFLGDKAKGPDGKTPLTVELPLGETPVVIELDTYVAITDTLKVRKPSRKQRRRPQVFSWKLEAQKGSISVVGPIGAAVWIDQVEVGTAPGTFEAAVGRREVQLAIGGVRSEPKTVVVSAGAEAAEVAFSAESPGEGVTPPAGAATMSVDKKPAAAGTTKPRREPLVAVSLRYELAARTFRYKGEDPSAMLVEVPSSRVSNVGFEVAAYPFRATGIRALHPLSIHGAYLYGVPNAVKTGALGFSETIPPETFQQTMEASVRYRFAFAKRYGFEVDPGFGRYQLQFSGVDEDIERLPHIDYTTVRIGGRLVAAVWKAEAYAGAEYRHVLGGGGELKRKFPAGTSGAGYSARLGAGLGIGRWLRASAEAGMSGYSWDFESSDGDENAYTGGTDRVLTVGLGFGGVY